MLFGWPNTPVSRPVLTPRMLSIPPREIIVPRSLTRKRRLRQGQGVAKDDLKTLELLGKGVDAGSSESMVRSLFVPLFSQSVPFSSIRTLFALIAALDTSAARVATVCARKLLHERHDSRARPQASDRALPRGG